MGTPAAAVVPCVVVFNGGSSSIRFAVYAAGDTLRRRLEGKIDRIGASDATFIVNDPGTGFREIGDGMVLPREELAVAHFGHAGVAIIIIPCGEE